MLNKIPEKLYVPAAIVAGCGFIATAIAYAFAPPEQHDEIVLAVSSLWGFVQMFLPALLKSGGDR